jgi:transcriptional activator HAC1
MSEMHSWTRAASPNIKFEGSPAESLLSTPDEMYPSLFGGNPAPTTTVNPLEMMSPESISDDSQHDLTMLAGLSAFAQPTLNQPATPADSTPEPEKKQVKKRKSWGQVLPEPKTNLPPRKRAKTEDEKEQRRVERVLRNRRAAQSSRERKRLEVEGLEQRNKELEAALLHAQQMNLRLIEELQTIQSTGGARTSPSFEGLRQPPVTFSQQLFNSQDGPTMSGAGSLEQMFQSIPSTTNKTVNPASLSPALSPVAEEADEEREPKAAATPVADAPTMAEANASPDATQHPAEMLCLDLQCRSAEAPPSAWQRASQQQLHPTQALLLQLQFLLASTSAMLSVCQRPLTQIAISLKAGFSLHPTQPIMNTIIWLVTTPHRSHSRTTSTSTSSSPTASSTARPATSSSRSTSTAAPSQTRRSSTLRLRTLRKILTCSPTLARPLMDATMAVLRLVSTEGYSVDRVSGADQSAAAAANGESQQQLSRRGPVSWPSGAKLPSKEVLLTLLWVLRVEERRLQIREQAKASSKPGASGVPKTTQPVINKTTYVLNVSSRKRSGEEESRASSLKRRRFC